MKRVITIVVLVAALILPAVTHADQSKMDLMLRTLINRPTDGKVLLSKAMKLEGEDTRVSCFVKTNDILATEAAIIDAGGVVNTVLKTILTAEIPLNALEMISDRDEVVVLEADRVLTTKMNAARAFTKVDDVQDGVGVSEAYNGNGVMVGIVDTALDWQNADFGGRVIWVQMTNNNNQLLTCDKADIDDGFCNIPSQVGGWGDLGHGTHVTGIAAGADSVYKGVAPEAWIGFVFNPFSSNTADSGSTLATAVIDSTDDLFFTADMEDVAAVVNLSLGTSLGAHDDTSLLEKGLNELVAGTQGRIIVNAAGNENVNGDG